MHGMPYTESLSIAGVPDALHADAWRSLDAANRASEGLTAAKLKTRLFMAGKIAKVLPWGAERLRDVKPEWADHDVAPCDLGAPASLAETVA